ncbi:ribose-5-phosphate isomerase RpiA [archaeon]
MSEPKRLAGEKACEYVKDGMVLGLGTGSTVYYTLKKIAELGLNVTGVCTSVDTENKCKELGIKTAGINEHDPELAIDGADEIDGNRHLIKGGGGALTREKIVDYRAKEFIVIAEERKVVGQLGETFFLPVEVIQFAWERTQRELKERFERVEKREFTTDNGNYILDCHGKIADAVAWEKEINSIPGVVENGLFTRDIKKIIVGNDTGVKEI